MVRKSHNRRGVLDTKHLTPLRLSAHISGRISYLWSQCCRLGTPFKGPKLGSCLTLRNELSGEIYVLTKQDILLGIKAPILLRAWAESSRIREPRRTALPHSSLIFCGDGISFWVVFSQSF